MQYDFAIGYPELRYDWLPRAPLRFPVKGDINDCLNSDLCDFYELFCPAISLA
jgi:hypothetical protein